MKFVLILATFFLAANAALDKEYVATFMTKVKAVGEECVPETSASKEDVTSLLSFKIPESHEGKCLIFCFHKKFHIQHEDGSVDKEGTMQALEPLKADADMYEKAVKVVTTCAETPVVSDPCDYAADLAMCAIKEGKSLSLDELLVLEMD